MILDDPFDDPPDLPVPDRSPEPTKEQLDVSIEQQQKQNNTISCLFSESLYLHIHLRMWMNSDHHGLQLSSGVFVLIEPDMEAREPVLPLLQVLVRVSLHHGGAKAEHGLPSQLQFTMMKLKYIKLHKQQLNHVKEGLPQQEPSQDWKSWDVVVSNQEICGRRHGSCYHTI